MDEIINEIQTEEEVNELVRVRMDKLAPLRKVEITHMRLLNLT